MRTVILTIVILAAGCRFLQPPIVLSYSIGTELTEQEKKIIADFESANPGIVIEPVRFRKFANITQHDSYVTYLATAEETVDVFSFDIIWLAEFATANWILKLDPYFSQEELNQYIPSLVRGGIYKNQLYGIPGFADIGLIYYNKRLLRKRGIKKLKINSWNDLYRVARRFGRYGFVYQAKESESLMCNLLEHFDGQFKIGNELAASMKSQQDSWLGALRSFKNPVRKRITPANITSYREPHTEKAFLSGKYAFARNWPYMLQSIRKKGWKWGRDVGVLNFPRRPTMGGWYMAVNRNSRHPEAAVKFVKYLTSEAVQRFRFDTGDNYPSIAALYRDKEFLSARPEMATLFKQLQRARARPIHPRYYEFSTIAVRHISRFLRGAATPRSALSAIRKEMVVNPLPPLGASE